MTLVYWLWDAAGELLAVPALWLTSRWRTRS